MTPRVFSRTIVSALESIWFSASSRTDDAGQPLGEIQIDSRKKSTVDFNSLDGPHGDFPFLAEKQ